VNFFSTKTHFILTLYSTFPFILLESNAIIFNNSYSNLVPKTLKFYFAQNLRSLIDLHRTELQTSWQNKTHMSRHSAFVYILAALSCFKDFNFYPGATCSLTAIASKGFWNLQRVLNIVDSNALNPRESEKAWKSHNLLLILWNITKWRHILVEII
jgi:hypothetical protein